MRSSISVTFCPSDAVTSYVSMRVWMALGVPRGSSAQSIVLMRAIKDDDMPQDPMLYSHLESFVEIARRGAVSRAAEALFLTQPAITARLKSLEGDLGVELFVRSARGMKLSDAGRAFLPYAERALASFDEGRQLVTNLREGTMGALVIAAAPAVSTYVLPEILRDFRATHPRVRLGVRTGHTEEVLEMVLRGEAHVGIGRPIRHPDIELIPVMDDEMLLVVSARHHFARRGKVSLRELAGERLLPLDTSS